MATVKPKPDPVSDVPPEPVFVQSSVTEAGVSANAYFISPRGGNWQLTVRSNADEAALYNVLNLIALSEDVLKEDGWTFKQVGKSSDPAVSAAPAAALPGVGAPVLPGSAPAAPPTTGGSKHQDTTFPAKSLKIHGEGQYWTVVSNSNYPKYPTAIPEDILAAAGIPPDALDATLEYPLPGWTAVFERNEKGNPKRVVKLIRPG